MATYGLITEHTTPADGNRGNRWWITAASIPEALGKGVDLVNVLKPVFGSLVTFVNVHVWVPGASPNQFQNQPISIQGTYTAANPTSAQVVSRIEFAAGLGNYPNYKDFRICINPDQQSGRYWNGSYSTVMIALADELDGLGFLVAKDGTPLTSPSYTNLVRYRQLSKRWYNRAT